MIPDEGLQSYFRSNGTCRHIILIDPAEQEPETAANRVIIAVEEGSKMVFIGGSTDTPNDIVHATCLAIQEALELRVFAASQHPTQDRPMENTSYPIPWRSTRNFPSSGRYYFHNADE